MDGLTKSDALADLPIPHVCLTLLESTLVKHPRSVDSKGFAKILRALESTLTRKQGGGGQLQGIRTGPMPDRLDRDRELSMGKSETIESRPARQAASLR